MSRASEFPLCAVIELGADETSVTPLLVDHDELVLHPDENIIWQGSTFVHAVAAKSAGSMYRLLDIGKCDVWLTDERFCFSLDKYDKGHNFAPLTGGALFKTASVVSHVRASARRRGKVLAGQVRYADMGRCRQSSKKPLLAAPDTYVSLELRTMEGQHVGLEFNSKKIPPESIAAVLESIATAAGDAVKFES